MAVPVVSLADTLALLEPHVAPALASGVARERLHTAAARLPAALSHCLYIEARPATPDAADLIVDVDDAGREILAGRNPHILLEPALAAHPTWQRVGAFARAWLDRRDTLDATIADAWLEFDVGARAGPPVPSVFVDFTEETFRDPSATRRLDALLTAANALAFPVTAATSGALQQSIAALPASGLLLYAGFMLARSTDAVRICIMGLSRRELSDYLQTVAWPGDPAAVDSIVAALASEDHGAQPHPAILHMDVGAGPLPHVGLEYPFSRRPQLSGELSEGRVLDVLVARDLLTTAQRDALMTWPGYERRTMPHEAWPSHLVRRVNHVKLVIRDGGTAECKVYLCAEHTPARAAAK